MTTHIRHIVLSPDLGISEFSAEMAAKVANGALSVPQFADRSVHYLQVVVNHSDDSELKVQIAGAQIRFDHDGWLAGAQPEDISHSISRFAHEAVVQWALRDIAAVGPTLH